ncbi:MAG: aspartyl protease family protein [Verrucomicrobiaceae bacterium]|nr:aspartyl protease family protein [Verrucomicrobiaceae bacterium]
MLRSPAASAPGTTVTLRPAHWTGMGRFFLLGSLCLTLLSCATQVSLERTPGSGAAEKLVLPMHFRADAPHVTGRLNGGKELPMLLDTGASICVLEGAAASANGVRPGRGRPVRIRGIHGNTSAAPAVIRSLSLGPWQVADVPCYVRQGGRLGDLGNVILGIDFVRRHCRFITFDYAHGRVELGFDRSFSPRQGAQVTRAPFRLEDGLPMIRVSSGGLSWDAIVDTGSSWGIVIDQLTATHLGHPHDGASLGRNMVLSGVGGSISADDAGARVIRVPAATVGGRTTAHTDMFVMPGPMRIGSRFWHGSRLTLDFRSRTLWLER